MVTSNFVVLTMPLTLSAPIPSAIPSTLSVPASLVLLSLLLISALLIVVAFVFVFALAKRGNPNASVVVTTNCWVVRQFPMSQIVVAFAVAVAVIVLVLTEGSLLLSPSSLLGLPQIIGCCCCLCF